MQGRLRAAFSFGVAMRILSLSYSTGGIAFTASTHGLLALRSPTQAGASWTGAEQDSETWTNATSQAETWTNKTYET